ncbi:MAG: cytochrome c family protein [Alphaproteobacteria bacterium]|nr:cytochrome c family protein [Alphaproteobacteria bacterium]
MVRSVIVGLVFAVGLSAPAWAQDAAAGEKDAMICRACHQIGPGAKNGVGPVLNGVVGRKAGTYPGYTYSEANKNSGLTWTEAELEKYLANPQGVVPHTKMIFPGIKDPQKVKDVVAFLAQYDAEGNKKK